MCPQFDPGRNHKHKNERLAVEEAVSRFFLQQTFDGKRRTGRNAVSLDASCSTSKPFLI